MKKTKKKKTKKKRHNRKGMKMKELEKDVKEILSWGDLGRELRPAIKSVELILVELVCAGCMRSDYRQVLAVGMIDYPKNLYRLPQVFGWDKNSLRHIDGVFSGGYAFCGLYHVVRLWRMWEGVGID